MHQAIDDLYSRCTYDPRLRRFEADVPYTQGRWVYVETEVKPDAEDPVIPSETINGTYWPTMKQSERLALEKQIDDAVNELINRGSSR
jgi:hypothetical protein